MIGNSVNTTKFVSSRDHPHLAKIGKKLQKHFFCLDAVVKSGAASLHRVADVVIFHEAENGVGKRYFQRKESPLVILKISSLAASDWPDHLVARARISADVI